MPSWTVGVGNISLDKSPHSVNLFVIFRLIRALLPSITVGVRQYPDTFTSVMRTDARSRNNNRPDFITELFQVNAHVVECHTDESNNILTNNPAWPTFPNNTSHFRPEMTVIKFSEFLASEGKRLARETAGNDVDVSDSAPLKRFSCDISDVCKSRNVSKILPQYSLAKLVDLAECNSFNSANFRRQAKAANATKKI